MLSSISTFSLKISSVVLIANCTISLNFANFGTNLLKTLNFSGQFEYQQNIVTFCENFWGLAETLCYSRPAEGRPRPKSFHRAGSVMLPHFLEKLVPEFDAI